MDLETALAAADAHAASRARAQEALRRSAEISADLEERRARHLAGEDPELWQLPVRPAPAPVRAEPQKPAAMPAEHQKAWDAWARTHVRNAIEANNKTMTQAIAEFVATYVGKRVAAAENRLGVELDANIKTGANILARLMSLEAARDGRSLSRVYPGAHHADA